MARVSSGSYFSLDMTPDPEPFEHQPVAMRLSAPALLSLLSRRISFFIELR